LAGATRQKALVKPWVTLAEAAAPDGGRLVLVERDREFAIKIDGRLLMSSRTHGSEEAMAEVGLPAPAESQRGSKLVRGRRPLRVLVGGLGFGYTLKAVLARAPSDAEVVVAELSGPVIDWNNGPLAHLAGHPLKDRRVRIKRADVWDLLPAGANFDSALLDVDNGPAALTTRSNRTLYHAEGLARLRAALAPEGVAVFWSAAPDDRFTARLKSAGFAVDVRAVPARAEGRGGRHILFVARPPGQDRDAGPPPPRRTPPADRGPARTFRRKS
jgi:spermidine synthase